MNESAEKNTSPKPEPTRRQVIACAAAALAAIPLARVFGAPASSENIKADVCVYGGTSGGVIASVALAKLGRNVVLVEPTNHLGGMTSGGLGWVDYRYAEWPVGGLAGQWFRDIKAIYAAAGINVNTYGNSGWVVEPHVAEDLFDRWAANNRIRVVRASRLSSLKKEGRRILSVTLDKAPPLRDGAPNPQAEEPGFMTVEAAMFMDCSYEGDLLGAAGVSVRTDREGRDEYGESAAGLRYKRPAEFAPGTPVVDPYVRPGDPSSGLLPLISDAKLGAQGSPSPLLQAYNFRLCLVKDNPIPIAPPENYDPMQFEILARMLRAYEAMGNPVTTKDFFSGPWRLLKFSLLPRGKTDVNNAGHISMDFVGAHTERYASASWAQWSKIWRQHEQYQRGMLYFLRTDPRVSDHIRRELNQWGLPRDEFTDIGGWPTQLYVREARRMVGRYVMKQTDCEHAPVTLPDAIGLGVYSLDSHGCQRVVVDGAAVTEGGCMVRIPGPYPIPYRAITPVAAECENLLVTFCISSTHVAFASLRMEPQLMVLSESAAHAAHLAIMSNKAVQDININALRKALQNAGQALDAQHQG